MKGPKIIMIVSSIVALLIVGGCTVKRNYANKTNVSSSTKDLKEDKGAIKKKQLDSNTNRRSLI